MWEADGSELRRFAGWRSFMSVSGGRLGIEDGRRGRKEGGMRSRAVECCVIRGSGKLHES